MLLFAQQMPITYNFIFQPNFNPTRWGIDYESAMIPSIRLEFPNSILCGCFFHFGQCLFRAVTRLGLRRYYREENGRFKVEIGKFGALAFIPLPHLQRAYDALLNQPNLDPRLGPFITYFEVSSPLHLFTSLAF
jgi:hypothetical protein